MYVFYLQNSLAFNQGKICSFNATGDWSNALMRKG